MEQTITVESALLNTPRVAQVTGMFDMAPERHSRREWAAVLPLEEKDWNVGLIVGPSGAGKTVVARALFGEGLISGFDWPHGASILDVFPQEMSIKQIVSLLSAVGFLKPARLAEALCCTVQW